MNLIAPSGDTMITMMNVIASGTLTSTAVNSAFMVMELGSRRVWPVERGCLLLLGTCTHFRYVRGSVLAHLFLCLLIPTCVSRLITLWYLGQFLKEVQVKETDTWVYRVPIKCETKSKWSETKSTDWLIDYLLLYVQLKNVSLIWRRHHYRWKVAKFRPMLGALGLWAGRNLYCAISAAKQDLNFPPSHQFANYNTQGNVEDLF
jgi:hypothetical protein